MRMRASADDNQSMLWWRSGGRWRRMMKIPTPIAAAAASARARRSEGITDASYLDQLTERSGPEPAA
jgi:hypothetical protein